MVQTSSTSNQFSINAGDLLRGLLVAVITPVFTIMVTSLEAGSLTFNWKVIATVGLAAGLSYILKNFLTPARITITDKATVEAVKEGEAQVKIQTK